MLIRQLVYNHGEMLSKQDFPQRIPLILSPKDSCIDGLLVRSGQTCQTLHDNGGTYPGPGAVKQSSHVAHHCVSLWARPICVPDVCVECFLIKGWERLNKAVEGTG